tara:strand:+ start:1562 stop:1906 length:345 start_codon:yes stop_codon:yes gene_type:complete
MKKFLKFKVNNANQVLIDCDTIAKVEVGANDDEIDILTNITGHVATGAAEVLSYKLTFATGASGPQNGVGINEIVEAIESSYTTSWTNPVKDMSAMTLGGFALASIAIDQKAFA